jgi:hypothetical protein
MVLGGRNDLEMYDSSVFTYPGNIFDRLGARFGSTSAQLP